MSDSPFDAGARDFTADVDASLAHGRYHRGRLFVAAVTQRLRPPARLLDLGCGPGRIAHLLAAHGFDVTAVDPSPAMLAEARRQTPFAHLRFVDSDGERELAAGDFAGVVLSSVIEFVADPDALLSRVHAALDPGGAVFISYANRDSLWRRLSTRLRPHPLRQHLWRDVDARAHLARAGFSVDGATRFFDCAPLDRRGLGRLTASALVGTLGLLVASR